MTKLLIANYCSERLAGGSGAQSAEWMSHRIAWFAEDHDVLVFATLPESAFIDYVCQHIGTDRSTLSILVPPLIDKSDTRLTAERLKHPAFLGHLEEVLNTHPVSTIVPLWPTIEVANLAHDMGLESALPGYGFLSQDGGMIAASKTMFRTIAAGTGVPIPAGEIATNTRQAADAVERMLNRGWHAIVKAEFLTGGSGNDIYTTDSELDANSGRRTVVVDSPSQVVAELEQSWKLLSNDGQAKVVIERFYEGSRAVFTECVILDEGIEFGGEGEMLFNPRPIAEVMPIWWLSTAARSVLASGTHKLCSALQALGHRGNVSADAIVTPTGEVLFTEYNSRVTTSTHIYEVLGKKILGPDYADHRVLHDNGGWIVPSYEGALQSLREAGLAFDSTSRTGVIACSSINSRTNELMYCAIANDFDGAAGISRAVQNLFPGPRAHHPKKGSPNDDQPH